MSVPVQKLSAGRFPSCTGEVIFFVCFFQANWMRAIHIVDGSMLCSKSINLHVTLKHTLIETFRIRFDHVSEHHGPAKLAHTIETINLTIISSVTVTPTLSA